MADDRQLNLAGAHQLPALVLGQGGLLLASVFWFGGAMRFREQPKRRLQGLKPFSLASLNVGAEAPTP